MLNSPGAFIRFLCAACSCIACGPSSPVAPHVPEPPIERFTVTGRVTAAGQPVGGASVSGWHQAGFFHEQIFADARTAADGSFRMANVPGGRVHVSAAKSPMHNPCMSTAVVSADTVIDLELVVPPSLRPSRVEPLTVMGIVSDPIGQPISGASVVAFLGHDDFADLYTRTDNNGRYLLCGLFPDFLGTILLSIEAAGFEARYYDFGLNQPTLIGDGLFVLDVQVGLKTR